MYYKNKKDYKNWINKTYPFIGCGAGESSGNYNATLGLEDVCISTYGLNSNYIYSTVIHEIAHTSHYWNISKSTLKFFKLPENFRNTYARGIENYFSKKRYGGIVRDDFTNVYTGIFDDLMDDASYYFAKDNGPKKYGEFVSGFSIIELENSVFNSSSLDDMKQYLKKTYSPSAKRKYSEKYLDNLFEYWK